MFRRRAPDQIPYRRVHTPTVIQMEAVECGSAALGIVLAYHRLYIPPEELRVACGVSRDGSKASNMLKAARKYGMFGKAYRKEPIDLRLLPLPMIVFWNFNHFVVVEGFSPSKVYLNDPAIGPRTVSNEEFDESFTGVVLVLEPGLDFKPGGRRRSLRVALSRRLAESRSALALILLTGLALVVTGFIIPAFARLFIDQVLIAGQNWLQPLLIGMALTALLRAAWTWLQQNTLLRLETRLAITSSSQFLWHVLHLPIEFFTQRYAGDISSRVTINDRVARILSGQLATVLLNGVLILFYALIMLRYDVLLTMIGLLIALLNISALRIVSRRRIDTSLRLTQEQSKLISTTFNGLQIIETLKATGSESDFFARWAGYQAKAITAEQQLGTATQWLNVLSPLLMSLNTIAILTIGGLRIMDGQLTIGTLVAFQTLMASFMEPITTLVGLGATLQQVEADMNRLDDILSYPTDAQLDSVVTAPPDAPTRLAGYLELNNLTFGYSRLEKPLIQNFSLKLKPGDRVALVGGSGSGKSTVAKVVAGLYETWEGEILFDGISRRTIPRRVLNNSLALVDQDISLFEGSIRENLTLWDDTVPDADVIQAAKDACIHADISNRPDGYDHPIEESGRNFSGGQRQRLEIARALVNNPTLLVLDEATSALDAITEKMIDDNLRRRGCTCLIIAHRLSTIRDCDEIIVLDSGKIVQRGTHKSMYRTDGPYSRLIRSEEFGAEPSSQSVLDLL